MGFASLSLRPASVRVGSCPSQFCHTESALFNTGVRSAHVKPRERYLSKTGVEAPCVAVLKIPSYTGSDPSEVLHMNDEDFLSADSILSKKIGQANRHIYRCPGRNRITVLIADMARSKILDLMIGAKSVMYRDSNQRLSVGKAYSEVDM